MSTTELLDDLEAGELSVEFEGLEPWEVLEWAMERFGDRLALSTAFQDGDVALIDMAHRIDPSVRVFSIDTGRLPQETHDLVEARRFADRVCVMNAGRIVQQGTFTEIIEKPHDEFVREFVNSQVVSS